MSNAKKRKREIELNDVLMTARSIWGRDEEKKRRTPTEDCEFRQFFVCGPVTAFSLWSMLMITGLVPDGGCFTHLLWTLMFLKTYSNEGTLSTLIGFKYPKTFRWWTCLFFTAIAGLEPSVVSFNNNFFN